MEEDINIIVTKWEGFLKELYCESKWILPEERYNEKLWLIFPHYLHLHTNPRYLLCRIQQSFQMRHAARLNSDNKHYLTTCNLLSFSKESKLAKCMQLNTFHVSSDNILWKWKEKPHTNELIENPRSVRHQDWSIYITMMKQEYVGEASSLAQVARKYIQHFTSIQLTDSITISKRHRIR